MVERLAGCVLGSAQAPHIVALVTGNLGKSLNPPRPPLHICKVGRAGHGCTCAQHCYRFKTGRVLHTVGA